jgi:amino acid transporter
MARDGLLPKAFLRVHPRLRCPHVGTLATGITAALIAGVFPLRLLGELISIGTLLAFAIVCVGVIVLRRRSRASSFALRSWQRRRSIHGYGRQCGWPRAADICRLWVAAFVVASYRPTG